MPSCAVISCKQRSGNVNKEEGGISFHRFPSNFLIKEQWIKATGRNDWIPTKTSTLCSKHFAEDDYMLNSIRRALKPLAIPHIEVCIQTSFNLNNLMTEGDRLANPNSPTIQNVSSLEDTPPILECNQDNSYSDMSAVTAVVRSEPKGNPRSKHECRTCLQVSDEDVLFPLFQTCSSSSEGMESTLGEDLAKIANVQLSETDRHSKFICNLCVQQLKAACQFIFLVKKNDKILNQRCHTENISCEEVWPKPIQIDKTIACENILDVDIKQEVLSEDEYECNLEDQYIEADFNNRVEIKVEPEEIIDPEPVTTTVNGNCTTLKFECGNVEILNGDAHYDDELMDTKVKDEPLSDTEESEVALGDLPLECLLCARCFVSVSGLKAHVIAQHSYKSVKRKTGDSSPQKQPNAKFICAICKRSFTTSTDLMVHETCHNKDVCYGCNAKFDSFEKLSAHRKRCKAILSKEVVKPKTLEDVIRPSVEEADKQLNLKQDVGKTEEMKTEVSPDMVTCDMCSEQFSDTYYMKIHKEIHHSQDNSLTQSKTEPIPMEIDVNFLKLVKLGRTRVFTRLTKPN